MYQVLDSIPLWGIFAIMAFLFLLAAEVGFRLGRYRSRHGEAEISHANAIIAATLALMAFMLAFTFGMGGSRFDTRRHLVVEESTEKAESSLGSQHHLLVLQGFSDVIDRRILALGHHASILLPMCTVFPPVEHLSS